MVWDDLDPISPELALVSPELAARARAALPERPWEHVRANVESPYADNLRDLTPGLSAGPPSVSSVQTIVGAEVGPGTVPDLPVVPDDYVEPSRSRSAIRGLPYRPVRRTPRSFSVGRRLAAPPRVDHPFPKALDEPSPARALRPPAPAPPSRSGARRRGVSTVVMVLCAFVAVFALSELPAADAPTLATSSERANTQGTKSTATQGKRSGTTPVKPAQRSAAEEQPAHQGNTKQERKTPQPRPVNSDASKPKAQVEEQTTERVDAAPRRSPIAGAGYVFGNDGRLMIGSDGRSITWFESRAACGLHVELTRIRITRTGTFTAQRSVSRGGETGLVRLWGKVVSQQTIQGVLSGGPGPCKSAREPFVARLS